MKKCVIVGVGKCLPGDPISNKDLLKALNLPDTINESFIEKKIGIKQRHLCRKLPTKQQLQDPNFNSATDFDFENNWGVQENRACSDLSAEAIKQAVQQAGIQLKDLGMIILSTATPDCPCPPTSSFVQDKLGINDIAISDIRSACSGSTQALFQAWNTIKTGAYKYVVVVGCEVGSAFGIVNKDDKQFQQGDSINAVLMGDAASAFVLKGVDQNEEITSGLEIIDIKISSIGLNKEPGMWLPGGGCVYPMSQQFVNQGKHHFHHDASNVLKNGPVLYMKGLEDSLQRNKITLADIDLILPHQANGNVANIGKALGIDTSKIYMNFENVGNTGNASLGLQLQEIVEKDDTKKNSLLLMLAAESTKWLYGATLLKYHGSIINKNKQQEIKQNPNILQKLKSQIRMWLVGKYINGKQQEQQKQIQPKL